MSAHRLSENSFSPSHGQNVVHQAWSDYVRMRVLYPIQSMVLLYMVTWIPSIYPSHVSIYYIYTSTMDPMGMDLGKL